MDSQQGQLLTFSEVSKHNRADDVWIIVDGKVYDITKFAPEHPGGSDIIYTYAGRDASKAYSEVHPPSLITETLQQIGVFDSSSTPVDVAPPEKKQQQHQQEAKLDEKPPLALLINLNDFEEVCSKSLSRKNWAFISGASNDNLTRDANKNWFQKIWFRPRILTNVGEVRMRSRMLGQEVEIPIWIAPAGLAKTAGPEGELALAGGAGATGVIQCISTTASFSLPEILSAAPKSHPFFFQLYVNKDRKKTEKLLAEVNAQEQVKAIFLTVDLPVVSKREFDERVKLEIVESSSLSGAKTGSDQKGAGVARSIGSFIDPRLDWDDLAWVRKHTRLPLVLKGIQSASDAKKAAQMGCQGIVVSNHGGRALDNGPPAILVLLELHMECPEIFSVMEVYIDGGIRRGSDILKAMCLGASGVGLGRPFMYAVNYGKAGVEHAVNSKSSVVIIHTLVINKELTWTRLEVLKDELDTAMRLCGLQDLRDADPSLLNTLELDCLVPRGPHHPYARKHTLVKRLAKL